MPVNISVVKRYDYLLNLILNEVVNDHGIKMVCIFLHQIKLFKNQLITNYLECL